MGGSRGGPTTKLHALVNGHGRLVAFTITFGQRGDAPIAADLIALLPASATLVADRAYDSDALRRMLFARGTTPIIPNGPRRKNLHRFDRTAYKRRNLVERAFAASRTSAALPLATTNSPRFMPRPSASPHSSFGGYESEL